MSPSNPSELEPTPSPETAGQGINQAETTPVAEKKEDTINEKIEAKAKSREFRDSFIEREEARWNTEAKKTETIQKEKIKFREGLAKNAKKIEAGIKNLKEPVKRMEDLPRFFRDSGMDEKEIHDFEKTFPIGHESIPPQNRHMAVAIFEAVNRLFKDKSSFTEGSFSSLALDLFESKRRASFVADQTAYVKYEDRIGEGFYRSKEGEALIRQNLRAEAGKEGAAKA